MYLLCEKLLEIEGLKLLQVNTDGLTIRYPRRAITEVQSVMDWWSMAFSGVPFLKDVLSFFISE
jgi:hypothetical protein